ncbi:response regulator [Spongiactinospora sp. TRM90649]|uniref:response regulator n=1 Tax=Spongiactinospora sp. TRM90649 TaxID=3031114 RepID=UPI0023F9BB8F|nr:response regulator [Spongiactinospora sp. TRM90649]MDF5756831.1 response regulator [Spongiactinospora sp. TRM90649]
MTGAEAVLLVDDQETNLVALEAILTPLGLPLVRAGSGQEAMRAMLRREFAVVLLDVLMPGMDGFETAAHIKRLDETKDVPIIFLTGAEGDRDHTYRGYSAGAADFLGKPFDPWVLRAKVSVFIDLHRKNRQLREQADTMRRLAARAAVGEGEPGRYAEFGARLTAVERQLGVFGATPCRGHDLALRELAARVNSLAALLETPSG